MPKKGQATRRGRFLPYRYERLGLTLEPLRCTLDGTRDVEAFNTERHLIDLSDFRFDQAELSVRTEVSQELLNKVLPPTERTHSAAKIFLAVRTPKTLTRISAGNAQVVEAPGPFTFDLSLRRADVLGSAELIPYLVRTQPTRSTEGYATLPGARLASGRSWEVRFDLLRNPSGAFLDVRYVSFKNQGPPSFPWPETLFQFNADSANPILWLNLDHPQVCEVLDSNANVGTRARMRDVFFDYMSHIVWTRLFEKAAADAVAEEEAPYEWQDNVLRQLLPVMFPEEANHESRLAALERTVEAGDSAVLQQRLDAVLQTRFDVPKHMTRLAEAGE